MYEKQLLCFEPGRGNTDLLIALFPGVLNISASFIVQNTTKNKKNEGCLHLCSSYIIERRDESVDVASLNCFIKSEEHTILAMGTFSKESCFKYTLLCAHSYLCINISVFQRGKNPCRLYSLEN